MNGKKKTDSNSLLSAFLFVGRFACPLEFARLLPEGRKKRHRYILQSVIGP